MSSAIFLEWDDVLAREDLVEGDFDACEGGFQYRGPLARMFRNNDHIRFEAPWIAWMNPVMRQWERWPAEHFEIDSGIPPRDMGSRRILCLTATNSVTLYPRHTLRPLGAICTSLVP